MAGRSRRIPTDPSPHVFFDVVGSASGRGVPEVWADPTRDGSRVAEQLGTKQDAASAYSLSTGKKFLEKLADVVAELTAQANPSLGERLRWELHQGEIGRILEHFLRPAAALPVMLWTHSVCWTDRCTTRINLGGEVEVTNFDLREYGPTEPVRLRFDYWRRPGRNWAGSVRPRNYVEIRPQWLSWAVPPGMAIWNPRFVRYREDSEVVLGLDVGTGVHRERLGAAALSVEHEPFLNGGLLPALHGRTYGLWRDPGTGLLRAVRVGFASPHPAGVAPGRLIDGVGIWDVQILKAQRFFVRPGATDRDDVLYDELTINFERTTSRVVFIGVVHDRVGYLGAESFGRSAHARVLSRILGT